jgi:uncharacterized protein (TIGR03067 family)
MTRHLSLFLATAALIGMSGVLLAADDKPDAGKKVTDQLQGTWKFQSMEKDGKALQKEDVEKKTITFTGDKWVVKEGDKTVQAGTHTFDPSKKPATVDAPVTEGENKGNTMLGIYELTDDTLKVCFDTKGKSRPTEFKTAADSGCFMAVVKKEKAK